MLITEVLLKPDGNQFSRWQQDFKNPERNKFKNQKWFGGNTLSL